MDSQDQTALLKQALQYQDALVGYAQGMLRDWNLAEDAVQEALVSFHKELDRLDQDRNLFAWLRGIVRNKALGILRSRRKVVHGIDMELMKAFSEEFESQWDQDKAVELKLRRRLLRDCMKKLARTSAQIMKLFYHREKTCRELATKFRKTENAIRIALHRTRTQLRECVDRSLAMEQKSE